MIQQNYFYNNKFEIVNYLTLDSPILMLHHFHQHTVGCHHRHCRWQYILQNCGTQIDTCYSDGLKEAENILFPLMFQYLCRHYTLWHIWHCLKKCIMLHDIGIQFPAHKISVYMLFIKIFILLIASLIITA